MNGRISWKDITKWSRAWSISYTTHTPYNVNKTMVDAIELN